MEKAEKKIRNNSLDIMKFVAALFVVGVHANFLNDIAPNASKLINEVIGRMAVPFFACVTGYFLSKKERKNNKAWIRNIESLLSYYIVFSMIYIIWGFINGEFSGMPAGIFLYTIIKRFVMYGTYYHLWFFPCMILGIIVLHFAISWNCEKLFWILSIAGYLFGAFTYTWYGIGEKFIIGLNKLIAWYDFTYIHRFTTAILPFVFLGNYISNRETVWFKTKKMLRRKVVPVCLMFFVFLNFVEIYAAGKLNLMEGTTGSFGTVFVILTLFIVLLQNPLNTRQGIKIGSFCQSSSIVIYGLHPLALEIIKNSVKSETIVWLITIIILCIMNWVWIKVSQYIKAFLEPLKKIYDRKIYPNIYYIQQQIERKPYHHFAYVHTDDKAEKKLRKKHLKIMQIKEGEYEYEYFNFCYLHNILSLIIYARYHKMYPQVCINDKNKDNIQWEWYFQPLTDQIPKGGKVIYVECDKKTNAYIPKFDDIFQKKEIHIWTQWYKKYIRLNTKTKEYIGKEYQRLFSDKTKVLGVICRGTDYLALKPSGHPVQPQTKEVIEYCKKSMKEYKFDAIYLATEERKIRDLFEEEFPGKILENKREYYDDIYDEDTSIKYIKDVHFERENDNYWLGLEYLSSIVLLSHCSALVGGNCGGTLGAIFLNDEKYEFVHVFDLGLYP